MQRKRAQQILHSEEYLESLRTPNGGYTQETLARLGVSWPPPKGWKKALTRPGGLSDNERAELETLFPNFELDLVNEARRFI